VESRPYLENRIMLTRAECACVPSPNVGEFFTDQ
jgi:hypothetical protein